MDILNGYFEIIPKDIYYLILQYVRKRPLQDSNADEYVIARDNHITYYHNNQLRWCSAMVLPIEHINLAPTGIIIHVFCEGRLEDRVYSRKLGTQYCIRFKITPLQLPEDGQVLVPQRGKWMMSRGIIWAIYGTCGSGCV